MPATNADIARVFDEIGDLLEIGGANAFRIRAYRNAARTIADHGGDLGALLAAGGELPKLPGIGADLAAKVEEIAATGTTGLLAELRREIPPAVTALLRIPGLGPKRVQALWRALDVRTLDELAAAARAQRIRGVPGFGERTEAKILQAVEARLSADRRVPLAAAAEHAEALCAYLRRLPGAGEVVVAGSYRRMRDAVGDLDFVATARDGAAIAEAFAGYPEVREVLARGPTRASVVLAGGLQADLRSVEPESLGAALCYFTGSKAHNIAIRRLAQERGLKINEYGVFRGERRVAGETETSVYAAVDLPWIPPELREGRGEIEAARAGMLPRLVERDALRGDLCVFPPEDADAAALRALAQAGRAAGLEYLAVIGPADARRFAGRCREIDDVNAGLQDFALLKGAEAEIRADGSLDLPPASADAADLVMATVRSAPDLPRDRQTERILRAMAHRRGVVLGRPAGEGRQAYDIDMELVARRAAECGWHLALDADPGRLPLGDVACMTAKERRVLVAIGSGASGPAGLDRLRFAAGQARRGWLAAEDVLNTRPLAELRARLSGG